MPTQTYRQRKFDARPDRIDYRDREYLPPLVSLPSEAPDTDFIQSYLPDYTKSGLILDQGREGACTGFGLAAVINYLLWREDLKSGSEKHVRVSERMLYHLARLYDEWPGEDYEGSSCRGAMKGWHRHGVCIERLWPYRDARKRVRFIKPKSGWPQDAAMRPLGAYYRINKDSIVDLQAAIHEVGAIYCSANVHEGWYLGVSNSLPEIAYPKKAAGGHAFALVGYNARGFIVQNSWGADWGYRGFALLTYEDWVQNGSDAWVAVLGAPLQVKNGSDTVSSLALSARASGRAHWFWRGDSNSKPFEYRNPSVEPYPEEVAYRHSIVLGNNGRPINRLVVVESAEEAIAETAFEIPLKALKRASKPRLAVYAHGGLNDERASINRVRVMAPYFVENDIHPLFITWKTGFGESLGGIITDALSRYFTGGGAEPAEGWLDPIRNRLKDAKDRSVEMACEKFLVKAIWAEMKQNAAAAAESAGGTNLLVKCLASLKKQIPKLEIHLVGHSAGSILLGHLLDLCPRQRLKVKSISLLAPACTVGFANLHYVKAARSGVVSRDAIHLDVLSDEREQADSVGPYGKSLLYLVSRALETVHKMPLLGMEAALNPRVASPDLWNEDLSRKDLPKWQTFARHALTVRVHDKRRTKVSNGVDMIPLAHGSFDNDVEVVTETLKRIRQDTLKARVENLKGF